MIQRDGYIELEPDDFENDICELRKLWKEYKKAPKSRNNRQYSAYVTYLTLIQGRYYMEVEDITCWL